jgi:hypothetical protein
LNPHHLQDLLLQTLEETDWVVQAYDAAVAQATLTELRDEWREARARVAGHSRHLEEKLLELDINPHDRTPGREIIYAHGAALVRRMLVLGSTAPHQDAEIGAARCLLDALGRCQLQWQLVGRAAAAMPADHGTPLLELHDRAYPDMREAAYSTRGWIGQLWIHRLGLEPCTSLAYRVAN